MARLKSGTELETLRRQQIELVKRIKEAEVKARQKDKADTERREQLAGRAILAHLAAHPDSAGAKAILSILEAAPFRTVDRPLFASILSPAGGAAPAPEQSEAVTDHAAAAE